MSTLPPSALGRPVRTVVLGLIVAACATVASPAAAADRIVYVCAPNLCVVDPASGVSSPLTNDGATAGYTYPGITRDGRRVSAVRNDDVVVGAYGTNLTERVAGSRNVNGAAIAPDGSGVAESHSYVENRYGCPLTGGCLELVDMSRTEYTRLGVPPEGNARSYRGGGGVAFLGGGSLVSSFYTLGADRHMICVVADPFAVDAPCDPRVSSSEALTGLAGSPDGTLIAATLSAPKPATATSVQLYDVVGGAPVRKLADNASAPTFSPDGKRLAYAAADGWIHTVSVSGGKSRRLVRGQGPSWGGGKAPGAGSAAGASVRSRSLRYRKGKVQTKVRCVGSATCRGSLRLKKGKSTLGLRAYRVARGKTKTVTVTPTARGKRTIAKARKHKVTVQLKPKSGNATTTKATLRR